MESMKGLQRLQDMEIETAQLRETLTEYNIEMADLKNKARRVDEVETKLEEYRNNIEDKIDTKVKAKEEKLNSSMEEKIKVVEEEKAWMEQKMAEGEQKTKGLQSLLDESQNEVYELKSRQDEAKSSESEVVHLQEQLLKASEGMQRSGDGDDRVEEDGDQLRCQLAVKDAEVVRLVEDVTKMTKREGELGGGRHQDDKELGAAVAKAQEVRQ